MQTSSDSAKSSSIIRYLGATGLALWALVMALGPDPGFSASWPWMALFWALQIGVGLFALQMTLYLISRADLLSQMPLWLLVLTSGLLGAAVLAPIYWLIGEGLMQQVLGFPATIDDEELIGVQQTFGWAALIDELGEISGPVITAWVLISWPRLQGLLPPLVHRSKGPGDEIQQPQPQARQVSDHTGLGHWRAALPSELGDDVIAVKSELQYLRVWTSRGCALVLGSLQEVEDSEGSVGMRLHRSWWVHARHVRSVRRRGDGAVCELSDGREVPVSRRRKADALARLGDAARYDGLPTVPSTSQSGPNQNARRNPT